MKLQEVYKRLETLTEEWMGLYRKGQEKGLADEELDRLRALNAEMDDLGKKKDELEDIEKKAASLAGDQKANRQVGNPGIFGEPGEVKAAEEQPVTLGDLFVQSEQYKALRTFAPGIADRTRGNLVEAKSFIEDAYLPIPAEAKQQGAKAVVMTGLTLPRPERLGLQRPASIQQPVIADLIPSSVTDQQALSFFVEGANTNAAAPTAEGAAAPESSMAAFTEVETRVRWIPNGIPVTEQTLRSEPLMRDYVNDTLLANVRTTEETQLISGNGTAPNLLGIFATGRAFQTQAKGTDNNFDAIARAMTRVRLSNLTRRYEPDAVVMHPTDVELLRLTRDANGNYIYGGPAAADGGVPRIWGVRVVESTTATVAGTARVGAFGAAARIFRYWEYGVTAFSEHSDYAARRQIFVRADTALALAVFQEQAFVNVTGIA